MREGWLRIHGVPTSENTASLARQEGIPLIPLSEAGILDFTVDGADEVDPNLDLIKGYGRAMVGEKVVAASSRRLVILIGEEKLVSKLGTRGKLPIEVTPFAVPLCVRRLGELGCQPVLDVREGKPFVTDNGNHILDSAIAPISDPSQLEIALRAIPGVVGACLFLEMADTILIGASSDLQMIEEKRREGQRQ